MRTQRNDLAQQLYRITGHDGPWTGTDLLKLDDPFPRRPTVEPEPEKPADLIALEAATAAALIEFKAADAWNDREKVGERLRAARARLSAADKAWRTEWQRARRQEPAK